MLCIRGTLIKGTLCMYLSSSYVPVLESSNNGGSNGLEAATARADVIIVETMDAEVYAAATWTPWLRFIRCWLVGARREEGGRSTLE